MGINAGFDMVPRLSKGDTDRQIWESFLNTIKELYQHDELVEVKSNYIVFKTGEHPQLPFESQKFLRFSSKISGFDGQKTNGYINTVKRTARGYFGSRIQYWTEACDQRGFYSWEDVHESIRSYEQPDEFKIPANITQWFLENDPVKDPNLQLIEAQLVAGKGRGLIARSNIAKGTRIIQEKPLLFVQSLPLVNLLESSITENLKSLSKAEQRKFLCLQNNFSSKNPFSGIVKTNALPCGSKTSIGGVYATICLINHSCLPNAQHNWNVDTEYETVHAVRDISAGEEITISYDEGGDSKSRRLHLKDTFGFDCNCKICSLPRLDLQKSDNRRLQIEALNEAIGNIHRMMFHPHLCLADCRTQLRVLEEEYEGNAGVLNARLYYDAYQLCIVHSDQARASAFARRMYEARVICEGEDSPVAQKAKSLIDNPSENASFGVTKLWITAKELIPKGINAAKFEEWLWRQDK